MPSWTEVNIYTGKPVDEDAPTNATGVAVAGTGDDSSVVPVRKKRKTFLDARTKEYKAHEAKLRLRREKRNAKKSAMAETISQKMEEFGVEKYIVESNMDMLKDIVKKKQAKSVKFKDGQLKVDMFTASKIVQVYDKVNATNKKKIDNMINGTKGQFVKISQAIMKL